MEEPIMQLIRVPAEYFYNNSIKEYRSWPEALVREFLQNSRDARSTRIDININTIKETKQIEFIVKNNGDLITEDVMFNALLTLGGSDKSGGAVGGFGQAKNLLYFSWPEWSIHSGYLRVQGSGPQYERVETSEFVDGVISRIVLPGKLSHGLFALKTITKDYLNLSTLGSCHVYLNGERVQNLHRKGVKLKKLYLQGEPFAQVYTNKSRVDPCPRVYVKGLYMFSNGFIPKSKMAISIELEGDTLSMMTSNRDSLRHPYSEIFQQFLSELTADIETATYVETVKIQRFNLTNKLNLDVNLAPNKALTTSSLDAKDMMLEIVDEDIITVTTPIIPVRLYETSKEKLEQEKDFIDIETSEIHIDIPFIIKLEACSGRSPSHVASFLKTRKAQKFLHQWNEILKEALKCTRYSDLPFTPGFIWSDSIHAQYHKENEEHFFFINPQRYELKGMSAEERLDWLMQCACHEVSHLFSEYHDHLFVRMYHEIWTKMFKKIRKFRDLRHDKIKLE
jgi:hypothetical protein